MNIIFIAMMGFLGMAVLTLWLSPQFLVEVLKAWEDTQHTRLLRIVVYSVMWVCGLSVSIACLYCAVDIYFRTL